MNSCLHWYNICITKTIKYRKIQKWICWDILIFFWNATQCFYFHSKTPLTVTYWNLIDTLVLKFTAFLLNTIFQSWNKEVIIFSMKRHNSYSLLNIQRKIYAFLSNYNDYYHSKSPMIHLDEVPHNLWTFALLLCLSWICSIIINDKPQFILINAVWWRRL